MNYSAFIAFVDSLRLRSTLVVGLALFAHDDVTGAKCEVPWLHGPCVWQLYIQRLQYVTHSSHYSLHALQIVVAVDLLRVTVEVVEVEVTEVRHSVAIYSPFFMTTTCA